MNTVILRREPSGWYRLYWPDHVGLLKFIKHHGTK